jgi:hypothetical protein
MVDLFDTYVESFTPHIDLELYVRTYVYQMNLNSCFAYPAAASLNGAHVSIPKKRTHVNTLAAACIRSQPRAFLSRVDPAIVHHVDDVERTGCSVAT